VQFVTSGPSAAPGAGR